MKTFKLNESVLRQIVAMSVNQGWAMRDSVLPASYQKDLDPHKLEDGVIEVMAAIAAVTPPERVVLYGADGEAAVTKH